MTFAHFVEEILQPSCTEASINHVVSPLSEVPQERLGDAWSGAGAAPICETVKLVISRTYTVVKGSMTRHSQKLTKSRGSWKNQYIRVASHPFQVVYLPRKLQNEWRKWMRLKPQILDQGFKSYTPENERLVHLKITQLKRKDQLLSTSIVGFHINFLGRRKIIFKICSQRGNYHNTSL